MSDLNFYVDGAQTVRCAASPMLALKLQIVHADDTQPVHTVVLRCQIQIEAPRRRYNDGEQKELRDLFGAPERWGQTLRPILWTNTSVVIPPFTGATAVDLELPCSFDFMIATTKYFAALEDGDVPLILLFSGTIFYRAQGGALQVAQISWEKEARYRLPVRVWREMMQMYYGNTAWLCLRRDIFDLLYKYKTQRGLPTWEETVVQLLSESEGRQAQVERS